MKLICKLILLCIFFQYLNCSELNLSSSDGATIEEALIGQIDSLRAKGINAQDDQGRTPLSLAVQFNQPKIFKELLEEKSIDINISDKDGLTPLAIAVNEGNVEAVTAILDACDKIQNVCNSIDKRDTRLNLTPLARAAMTNNVEIIKKLLEAGANPTAIVTRQDKNIPVAQLYKETDKDITELFNNKAKEFTDRSLQFIKLLHYEDENKAIKLLAEGIDVNAKTKNGWTPLYYAVHNRHKKITMLLINSKADINAKSDKGWTPLYSAIGMGDKEIVQMLIEAKADVDDKDSLGVTPLDCAILVNNLEIKDLLTKAGAKL